MKTADKLLTVMGLGIVALFLGIRYHWVFFGIGAAATLTSMAIALVFLPQEWFRE